MITKKQQEQFLTEALEETKQIVAKNASKIPAHWEEAEMTQYYIDKFVEIVRTKKFPED